MEGEFLNMTRVEQSSTGTENKHKSQYKIFSQKKKIQTGNVGKHPFLRTNSKLEILLHLLYTGSSSQVVDLQQK